MNSDKTQLTSRQTQLTPSRLVCVSSPQIFAGNQNHDTPELRAVGPLLTRFVRIYPERATNEGLGLRLELLGCELEGESRLTPGTVINLYFLF